MSKSYLELIIKIFVEKYEGKLTQKSKEWYENMIHTIGGSCISAVIGENKYKSQEQLILDKVNIANGIDNFTSNVATTWGNIFEAISEAFIKRHLNCNIYGENITVVEVFDGVRYSPDGIVCATFDDGILKTHYNKSENPEEYKICLIEIKSPLNRTPTDSVPKEYYHQIQLGLASIPICDMGIFEDFQYRKCSLLALNQESGEIYDNQPFDISYHSKYKKLTPTYDYLAKGLIALYCPTQDIPIYKRKGQKDVSWELGDNIDNIDAYEFSLRFKELVDCGLYDKQNKITTQVFNDILMMINYKQILHKNSEIYFANETVDIDDSIAKFKIDTPEGYKLFGLIPYKLITHSEIIVNKEDGYIEKVLPMINLVNEKINKILN